MFDRISLYLQPTSDPAVCADAKPHLLVIGRDSGKIQMYSLPHGALLTILEAAVDVNMPILNLISISIEQAK